MNSYVAGEQEESLFLLDEQPPSNLLQRSASFGDDDESKSTGLKSLQRILSASSALTAIHQPAPHRSLSAHDLTPPMQLNDRGLPPPHQSRHVAVRNHTNDIDAFVRQFETRLREHRLLWQKEFDSTVQRMTETKNSELESLKTRYETKVRTLEEANKQLEAILDQINEENKRLKYEHEHQKQQHKTEQVNIQEQLKDFHNEMERKIHEVKNFHDNDKQEIKRQHARIYQELLDETNQVPSESHDRAEARLGRFLCSSA